LPRKVFIKAEEWTNRFEKIPFQLAREGDAGLLKQRISDLKAEKGKNYDVNFGESRPYTANTALHYACLHGHLQVVRDRIDK
jgi:ankyrin repeat protein